MSKFFVPPECIKNNVALIGGAEAHHILNVMRLKRGDKICAFDGRGKLYQGRILDTENKTVKLKIESVAKDLSPSNLEITLVQALPKKNKMDYIIEKCTELGVHSIIPTQTSRTVVKLNKDKAALRLMRWQKIAREAAKQCGRTTIPRVKDLTSWPDALSALNNFDLKLLFHLGKKTKKLKDVLSWYRRGYSRYHCEILHFVQDRPSPSLKAEDENCIKLLPKAIFLRQNRVRRVAIFIGPEGDFTPDEAARAEGAGCIAVSLGKNVLKTDTAALYALAMINYEFS